MSRDLSRVGGSNFSLLPKYRSRGPSPIILAVARPGYIGQTTAPSMP